MLDDNIVYIIGSIWFIVVLVTGTLWSSTFNSVPAKWGWSKVFYKL